jgi:hypothetical protein
MNPRELILLSPYRLPGQNALVLANEDVAAILSGYSALWHPAALRGAGQAPRIASPYDHEQPTAGALYAVPESPPLLLPEDWDRRVRDAGAAAFRATADRSATLANLKEALRGQAGDGDGLALLDLEMDRVAPFLGIGFGYLVVEALFEAMEHENVLAGGDLWLDVQAAVAAVKAAADPDGWRRHLQAAADRLLAGREVLYPTTIHLVDLCLLDGQRLGQPWPASFARDVPVNFIASGSLLERLGREHPERLAELRERVAADRAEVCGGAYVEREDALLPLESQLWNLLKGLAVSKELLGSPLRVFARRRTASHPQLPLLLQSVGLQRVLHLPFDDAVLPTYRVPVVSWPSPDGKQVEAFARTPYAADNPQTFFHAAHYLHKTIMQDHAATLALLHTGAAAPWYADWMELSRFAPVLGQWTTLSRYLNDVLAGEYASSASADEFHADYLTERTTATASGEPGSTVPVSWFARQVRLRRRLDTAWTLVALHRGLAGARAGEDAAALEARLAALEDQVESAGDAPATELPEVEKEVAARLADRLQARAAADTPGYLVLNPCSFARRVALELSDVARPLPLTGPVKSCQLDGAQARVVVEVPALGFAWFPQAGQPGTPPQAARMRLADKQCVRNEFFEAEVDPATGGLRAIRDHRTRVNRLGQQLVFNPGSTMRAKEVKVTSAGPALGEIVSEGAILGEQDQVLATFRQRFRAWLGRPVLDLRIEIYLQLPPAGYPWHAYYGARFAWRDERATLLRGVNGTGYVTSHTRPVTPDYLEIRLGRQSTVLFPGGLPFHQRHGSRMLDVILIPEGETTQVFDLAIGLDREHPMQTALGMVTPVTLVPTPKGPPHVGATGWLFHLDASNLVLTSLRPAPGGADGVTARLLECGASPNQAEFRCVRDPSRAGLLDARGDRLSEVNVNGDAASFDVASGDLVHLRVDFGPREAEGQ